MNRDYELQPGIFTIGRAPDCQIVLTPTQVSKRHLEVRVQGEQVAVCDSNSRNNSTVNRREIRGQGWIALGFGDVIEICGHDFQLLQDSDTSGRSGSCIVENIDSGSGSIREGHDSLGSKVISLSKQGADATQRFTQLRALIKISGTLRDVLKTEDVLERAVAILFEILPAIDRAAICFFDDENVVQPKWWHVREGKSDNVIRVSQCIGRHVAETSEAIITFDATIDFEEAKSVHAELMRSVMCCPLINPDGKVFGIIHVDSDKANMFDEIDLEVLAAVAMQVALAINCSRLHAVAVADELLRQDVKRAHEVQQRYLPSHAPTVDGYQLDAFYRAAREVGGDYFDFVPLADGRLAIALGDVVGKGVPAALTMVRLATETRAGLEVCQSPADLLTRLNGRLQEDFVTLIVMFLDPATGAITLCNAGHEPPLRRRVDGATAPVGFEQSSYPIGVEDETDYQNHEIQLDPGECLLIFSDGFPDAEHKPSGRRFGSTQVVATFRGLDDVASKTIQRIVNEVDQFTEDSPQFDDMCMVCLKRESRLS